MIRIAKKFHMERHGHDGWIEILEREYADALIDRANAERIRRSTPSDYGAMTPADLQARVESALRSE